MPIPDFLPIMMPVPKDNTGENISCKDCHFLGRGFFEGYCPRTGENVMEHIIGDTAPNNCPYVDALVSEALSEAE